MARDAIPMRALLIERVPEPSLPPGLTVRLVEPDDVDILGELMRVAYAGTTDDAGETPEEHRQEAARTLGGEHGPLDRTASLVTEPPVAAVLVTHWNGHPLLAHALVTSPWRGHGLGTALLVRSANLLLATGNADWTLAVTRGNPAQHLYERLGFVEDPSLRSSAPAT